jgi:stress-induced morphogen
MALFVGENKTTPETKDVEKVFREHGFADVQSYRHSSASIRLRVRDERFRGLSRVARMAMLEPIIEKLPEETQQDLMFVLSIAPGEEIRDFILMNLEFEDPCRPRSKMQRG